MSASWRTFWSVVSGVAAMAAMDDLFGCDDDHPAAPTGAEVAPAQPAPTEHAERPRTAGAGQHR